MKVIDFSKIKKPIEDDTRSNINLLNMDEQDEIVHAAKAAVDSMDIPNASTLARKYNDGTIRLLKGNNTITESAAAGSSVTLKDKNIKIENASLHTAQVYVDITPQEKGGYKIAIGSLHSGSFDKTIDSTSSEIHYDVDSNGKFSNRDGGMTTEAEDRNLDNPHSKWVKDAVQTLELRLGRVMGPDVKASIDSQRPPNASTEMGVPPMAANAAKLSTLNLNVLTNDDNTPAIKQPVAGQALGK